MNAAISGWSQADRFAKRTNGEKRIIHPFIRFYSLVRFPSV